MEKTIKVSQDIITKIRKAIYNDCADAKIASKQVNNLKKLSIHDSCETDIPSHILEDLANESWDDECGNKVYRFDTLFIHDGDFGQLASLGDDANPESYFATWDHGQYKEDLATCLISFGIEPTLNEIYTGGSNDEYPDNKQGAYRIWVRHCYYQSGCGNPVDGWATDDEYDRDFLEFESLHEACEAADDMERGQYESRNGQKTLYLSHNQAGSTDFIVCEI